VNCTCTIVDTVTVVTSYNNKWMDHCLGRFNCKWLPHNSQLPEMVKTPAGYVPNFNFQKSASRTPRHMALVDIWMSAPPNVIFWHTRLNREQAIGHHCRTCGKVSIQISTKIRLMKVLVWPVATYGWRRKAGYFYFCCQGSLPNADRFKKFSYHPNHSGLWERMKKHVLTPLRWKDWERFCRFHGQQRKQISRILTQLE